VKVVVRPAMRPRVEVASPYKLTSRLSSFFL
jgi:hypothetical protein